jgi:Ca2+-binding RTX toxin-like protein
MGEGGSDRLYGNDGNDYLDGGRFNTDTLTGGAGTDTFVQHTLVYPSYSVNEDSLTDWVPGETINYVYYYIFFIPPGGGGGILLP